MTCIIHFQDFLDDFPFEDDDSQLPGIEEIIEDREAIFHLGEDAYPLLLSGLSHRKIHIRLRVIPLLIEMFPCEKTFSLLNEAMMDRNQKPGFRFHIARQMVGHEKFPSVEMIDELASSKGCNDRIIAAILMGQIHKKSHLFTLLSFLSDSNDCVKVAAFLSLIQCPKKSVLSYLFSFLKNATPFQIKLLDKNVDYYSHSAHYPVMERYLCTIRNMQRTGKLQYHPNYYEQSYSQEKLSKLDRLNAEEETIEAFSLFEN